MGGVRLSVIIPAYNNGARLREMLPRIRPPAPGEIIVVDDGSTDGTADGVAALGLPALRIIRQTNRGRAGARNAGAQAAAGEILLFLDADVRPAAEIAGAHLRHHGNSSGVAVTGRVLLDPAARTTTFMRARYLLPDLTVRRRVGLSPMHVTAANFSLTAAAFHRVGGFDETLSAYGWEDVDLALRLVRAGIALRYEPAALVYHHDVQTLDGLVRKFRQNGVGAVALWRKHGRPLGLGVLLEISPILLPLKRLVYRSAGIAGVVRGIRPWAERAGFLPLYSECDNFLLWQAFYEGVFAALARTADPAVGRQ